MDAYMKQFQHLKIQWEEIISATNNFDDNNCIGGGGFGKVYKGALARYKERSLVAFKRLDRIHGQGDTEFRKEITFLSRYVHENLISLLGFCIRKKEMILVYEHASRGSLDNHLTSASLTWKQRLNICIGAAKGLNHLHDPRDEHQRLIHCDVKSANILIDDQWNAKVADFGLSKVGPANQQNSILVTSALGTYGYIDPLFMDTYSLTKESDVYSFGVVLLEVLCGKLCVEVINGRLKVLVSMWKKSYEEGKLDEIIHQDLRERMDSTSLEKFSTIAFQCLKTSREERPLMSLVVKTLETALTCQEELQEYEQTVKDIVNAAVPPLRYRSVKELKATLYKGFLVNGGTTWISLNDNGERSEMISMGECVDRKGRYYSSYFVSDSDSRYQVGSFITCGSKFEAHLTTQFLSPGIKYTVNLIFKCPDKLNEKVARKQQYISLTYESTNGEKKISIVHLADKTENEWLVATLYQFTSQQSCGHLKIDFGSHENSLVVEGIKFQPMEITNVTDNDELVLLDEKYKDIIKSVEPPMIYGSMDELNMLLSTGVILNGGNTWFHLNDNGQHCELVSIKHCLIPFTEESYNYTHDYNSRFLVGSCLTLESAFKIRVRAQFLSPAITYTVNFVFKLHKRHNESYLPDINLRYKVEGSKGALISNHPYKREDDWWMVELCQFTSEGTTADLELIFEGNLFLMVVEGIEFLPVELEKVEHHILEETQPISSDSDAYWAQKVPNDYEEIIRLSKDSVQWVTNKEICESQLDQGQDLTHYKL